jgi:hypothetical protein
MEGTDMSFGFVIGNGESRQAVPARMLEHRQTYACNLAYRQFAPTNLICCDKQMIITALSEGAGKNSCLWTRKRWFHGIDLPSVQELPEDFAWPQSIKHDQPMHWGSGSYAALVACRAAHEILVFIGFDLWSKDGRVNNLFKGQKGYGPADADPVGPEGWIHQMDVLMKQHQDKQFVFLNTKDWQPPLTWTQNKNFNHDELKQLNNL